MEHRPLGRTGVRVSPLCLGAMMFGAWGNPDHDESIRIIHRALDAGINFVDTADVYARGESEEIVGKALEGPARRGRARDEGARDDGRRPEPARQLAPLDRAGGRGEPAPPRHRLDRPLPDPPPRAGHGHRRDARRADRSRPRGQGPLHRLVDVPGPRDRRGAVGGRAARPRALRLRAAALLDPRARDRARRAARLRALRHGRDPVEPARRRLAERPLPQGARSCRRRRAPSASRRASTCRCPRTSASSRPRERSSCSPRRPVSRSCTWRSRSCSGIRPSPRRSSGRGRWSSSRAISARSTSRSTRRCSTGSTRSCPPGTNLNPADAGLHAAVARGRLAATPFLGGRAGSTIVASWRGRPSGLLRIGSPGRTVPPTTTVALTPRRLSSRPTSELTNRSASLPKRSRNFRQPRWGRSVTSTTAEPIARRVPGGTLSHAQVEVDVELVAGERPALAALRHERDGADVGERELRLRIRRTVFGAARASCPPRVADETFGGVERSLVEELALAHVGPTDDELDATASCGEQRISSRPASSAARSRCFTLQSMPDTGVPTRR